MLLSTSNFLDRPYRILNQQESQDLRDFIELEERRLLVSLLGFELWGQVNEHEDQSNPSQAITELIEGGDYTHQGRTYHYDGLVDLLKPAVMAAWLDEGTYKFSAAGFVQATAQENFDVVDNEAFKAKYWNEYVYKVGHEYARFRPDGGTLYGFMKAHKDDYPDWYFTLPKPMNRFGL